jgi:hypothetical protein
VPHPAAATSPQRRLERSARPDLPLPGPARGIETPPRRRRLARRRSPNPGACISRDLNLNVSEDDTPLDTSNPDVNYIALGTRDPVTARVVSSSRRIMAGYPVHRTAMARRPHGHRRPAGCATRARYPVHRPRGAAAKVLSARKPDATTIQATVDTLLHRRLATLANFNWPGPRASCNDRSRTLWPRGVPGGPACNKCHVRAFVKLPEVTDTVAATRIGFGSSLVAWVCGLYRSPPCRCDGRLPSAPGTTKSPIWEC